MIDYDLSRRAVRDIELAQDWYDGKSIQLEFFDDVLLSIRAARQHPLRYPEVEPGVRGVRCGRFPYRIYYEVRANKIMIRAVYHTSRDPKLWDDPNRQ
ncbi:MAG TPA: type II toxin-antitoxin system RelE/ParE family toxin [Tepidisphaeraceae bacterium]|nr:type II toxin-antitoxin system RelE/ParE family toxin [Tepidisphaeraceae bacterium]